MDPSPRGPRAEGRPEWVTGPGAAFHLPPGRMVALPGRGEVFVREVAGPPGAPAVVLLHGVAVDADANWLFAFAPLGRHHRVVAPDLRGHGRTREPAGPWRMEDCADDVAALMRVLGIPRAVVAGYSLGGLVAQLVWRRHPERVDGLVLCATAASMGLAPLERSTFALALEAAGALTFLPFPFTPGPEAVGMPLLGDVADPRLARFARREMRRARMAAVVAAGAAALRFDSGRWIGGVDVPTAVVLTARDQVISPRLQGRLARSVRGASRHLVAAGHGACLAAPGRFVPALLEATASVAVRMADRPAPSRPAADGVGCF